MLAPFAKKFGHQIGGAIEHFRMTVEPFGAMNVALYADDLLNLVQSANGGLELADRVEGALADGLISVFLGEFFA